MPDSVRYAIEQNGFRKFFRNYVLCQGMVNFNMKDTIGEEFVLWYCVVATRALLGKTVFKMNIFVTSDVIFCKLSRLFEKKVVSLQSKSCLCKYMTMMNCL